MQEFFACQTRETRRSGFRWDILCLGISAENSRSRGSDLLGGGWFVIIHDYLRRRSASNPPNPLTADNASVDGSGTGPTVRFTVKAELNPVTWD